MRIRPRLKGEITVFLSLILSVILLLVISFTELSRIQMIKSQIVMKYNNGLTSILAEYNRPLLEKYNIFLLDGAYGGEYFKPWKLEEGLKKYLSDELDSSPIGLGYSIEGLTIDNYIYGTDNCGEAVFDQAVSWMEVYYGLDLADSLLEKISVLGDISSKLDEMSQINNKNFESEAESKDNIFKQLIEIKNREILSLVMGNDLSFSKNKLEADSVLSIRKKELFEGQSLPAKSVKEGLLFNQYLLQVLSGYTDSNNSDTNNNELDNIGIEKNNTKKINIENNQIENKQIESIQIENKKTKELLSYELEYIISGQLSDEKNLAAVVDKLVLIREAYNFLYLQTDASRKEEAEALASLALAITGNPAIIKAGSEALLLAWAFSESICEVRTLLSGGRIPLIKTGEEWHTSLISILNPAGTGCIESDKGLDYRDYLLILLNFMDKSTTTVRLMDIMENDVKSQENYSHFAFDNTIYGFYSSGTFSINSLLKKLGVTEVNYGKGIDYGGL